MLILQRLTQTAFVLFGISALVFLIFFATPGADPAARIAGRNATPEVLAAVRHDFGLDRPLPVQYALMMRRLFVTRDLTSFVNRGERVIPEIVAGAPVTLSLVAGAAVLWVLGGLAIGIAAALTQGGITDRVLTLAGLLGVSMPVFWVGQMANLVTQSRMHASWLFAWVPPLGYTPLSEDPVLWFRTLLIPWATLALLYMGLYGRVLRASLIEAYQEDYVRTARAKGLSETRVLVHHALRTSLVTFVSLFGLDFGALVGGGALLTEVVFGLQGVGKLTFDALQNLDLPVIMATVIYASFFVVAANALVDVAYTLLDPRCDTGVADPLLEVRDLCIDFRTRTGSVRAVDRVSFAVSRGEIVGLVGESGSGKTITMLAALGLIGDPNAVVSGSVLFEGTELVGLPVRALRRVRGAKIAMIFQDPMSAMNPVHTIGWQIVEQLRAHRPLSHGQARVRAVGLLGRMGIPAPESAFARYPHQLSGGMRQRAMIAMALSCDPALVIADEPTTALDVTVQAQILALLRDLRGSSGSSVVLITHDLGVVAETADRVMVMYAGRLVERGAVQAVLSRPGHPYTQGLLASIPPMQGARPHRLAAIAGSPPSPAERPSGCAFAPRCPMRFDACLVRPGLFPTGAQDVACFLAGGAAA